jgi:DNA-binding NarL/FixJ family response regulator
VLGATEHPRLLIADDHTLVAELCRSLLQDDFDIVGMVSDGHALVRSALALNPDVILIDIAMPLLNGLDAGQQVKEMLPGVKLIYLTMNPNPEVAAEAFRRGASGYLLKSCGAKEMKYAIRSVLGGGFYLSSRLAKRTVDHLCRQPGRLAAELHQLTERQREVVQLLAEGKAMKEVGDVLNMAQVTVAYHKYRIMAALEANSNADLVRYAIRNYMIAA